MPDQPSTWKLTRVPEVVDAWVERESPPIEQRVQVLTWLMGQREDPYRGMRRQDIPNLWFGPIPGTQDGWTVVTCTYWIFERTRLVRCDMLSTLNLPV